jgi:hypothetical protein
VFGELAQLTKAGLFLLWVLQFEILRFRSLFLMWLSRFVPGYTHLLGRTMRLLDLEDPRNTYRRIQINISSLAIKIRLRIATASLF